MDVLESVCGLRELALFAGAGGGLLGGKLLGWRTVCAVECDAYAASVLAQRQNDGVLEPFPIWDDVRTFAGLPWRGLVDVVSGGFPCQDINAAGKGKGIDGERSGLWSEFARIIGEVRPRFAFVENSPMLTSRGLGRVLGDLAEMGYDAEWGCVSAADAIWLAGDPCIYHERERIWIVAADATSERRRKRRAESAGQQGRSDAAECGCQTPDTLRTEREPGPRRRRVRQGSAAHGHANGVEPSAVEEVSAIGVDAVGNGAATRHAHGNGRPQVERQDQVAAEVARFERQDMQRGQGRRDANWWATEPDVGRVVDGLACKLDIP